jgi:uncharacterized protein YjbI with pentapeptide repeats
MYGCYSDVRGADLTNANLSGADARGASFQYAKLTGANLSGANLTNANFAGFHHDYYPIAYTDLSNADLSGADARGATFEHAPLTGANTNHLIQSNGHIAGLNLVAGKSLIVRDYDGNSAASEPTGPLPIVVEQHLMMNSTGTLHLEFDADAWDSTISFAPGISVTRGGTLELAFAPETNLTNQVGRTFDLFDWSGVTPTGTFAVESLYGWDLANLYTTGEVTLLTIPGPQGDYNQNGTVDAADFTIWRDSLGGAGLANRGAGISGPVGPADYNLWKTNFGQSAATSMGIRSGIAPAVPEPTTSILLAVGAICLAVRSPRSNSL